MIITCTRKFTFDAGHRVVGHEGKCRNLHGHGYRVLVTAQGKSVGEMEGQHLDILGRVIDFSVLKSIVGAYIDREWDHGMLLWENDPLAPMIQGIKDQKCYQLPHNPTAENIARFLLETVCPQLLRDVPVKVVKVRVWETENCYADAML